MTKRFILFSMFIAVGITACSSDDDNGDNGDNGNAVCETDNLRFEEDIQPIINANCATAGCHSGNTSRPMNTYEAVRDYALDGSLVARINLPASNPQSMPPSGPLDDCTIEKINAWVNDGAPM